ncbi:hypothetical protein [Bosea sp. PAMC 26642]|uniref:hypothetical protein n=1 Tax=Bosea sp. (strain PAMC 26642) TaxID=1792307 RepID=UPI0012E896BB|nr:hypothetical protein [Bosea sp. PAMC 26642]
MVVAMSARQSQTTHFGVTSVAAGRVLNRIETNVEVGNRQTGILQNQRSVGAHIMNAPDSNRLNALTAQAKETQSLKVKATARKSYLPSLTNAIAIFSKRLTATQPHRV